jgi:hypothetical protein
VFHRQNTQSTQEPGTNHAVKLLFRRDCDRGACQACKSLPYAAMRVVGSLAGRRFEYAWRARTISDATVFAPSKIQFLPDDGAVCCG